MSQENVEWLHQVSEARARDDAEALETLLRGGLAADFELQPLYPDRVVMARMTGRGAASGVPIDQPVAVLVAFEGDQAVWAKSFLSKHEALEAVGQSA